MVFPPVERPFSFVVGRLDAQPVEHDQHGGGLEGAAVVAMQHGLVRHGVNPFGQRGALEQGGRRRGRHHRWHGFPSR